MTTLSDIFRTTAELITGQLLAPGLRSPFSFTSPEPAVDFDKLPGFDDSIGEPSMRKCCAIGWKKSSWFLPGFTATKPLDLHTLHNESHIYGGPSAIEISKDAVGHIYTARGGILDIGHIRDHADLARYLAVQAKKRIPSGQTLTLSSADASVRRVEFKVVGTPSAWQAAIIGARLSYELSIWHEIVTWAAKKASFPTLQPYSAFSPEDNYSNLLGAFLGYQAILKPDTDFDAAMTVGLASAVFRLRPLDKEGTVQAVNYVDGHWFGYAGGDLILFRRHFDALGNVSPWLIQEVAISGKDKQLKELKERTQGETQPVPITVPEITGSPHFSEFYDLKLTVDRSKFADGFANLIPHDNVVTSQDFPTLIQWVRNDVLNTLPNGDRPD